MERDLLLYFEDIIEACDIIASNLLGITIKEFRNDIKTQDAVIRRFEIIGEAVKRIPDELKNKYPDIPWKNAAGFRDVLIHDYPEVVIDDVYITATEHLPVFKKQIEEVIKNLK
jgi:uncharacterized protein with HEPN domain